MKDWSFSRANGVLGEWPTDEKGEPVAPAFLKHGSGNRLELDMERNMLCSFGIPTVCSYPNNGEFGNVVLGFAGGGADIFVPVTMLEDAKNIINGETDINIDEVE